MFTVPAMALAESDSAFHPNPAGRDAKMFPRGWDEGEALGKRNQHKYHHYICFNSRKDHRPWNKPAKQWRAEAQQRAYMARAVHASPAIRKQELLKQAGRWRPNVKGQFGKSDW